jgi:hypothetical protein
MQMNELFVKMSIPEARNAANQGLLVQWRPDPSLPEAEQYAMVFVPKEGFEIK